MEKDRSAEGTDPLLGGDRFAQGQGCDGLLDMSGPLAGTLSCESGVAVSGRWCIDAGAV